MSSWLIGLIIFVVIGWIWIAYEIYRAPVMPDDYDLSIEEKKVWDELKSKGNEDFEDDYENQPFGD